MLWPDAPCLACAIRAAAFAGHAKSPVPGITLMKTDQAPAQGSEPANEARLPGVRRLRGRLAWPVAALLIAALCLAAWLVIFKVTSRLMG